MKRVFAMLLALAMLTTLFVGCGSSGTSAASSAKSASTAEENAAPAVEPTEVPAEEPAAEPAEEPASTEEVAVEPAEEPKIMIEYPLYDEPHSFSLWTGTAPDINDIIKSLDQFTIFRELEKATNVTLDAHLVSFMVESEQFQLMVATEDYTDIVCKAVDNYTGTVDQAIEQDFLIDLTPYIEEDMPNLNIWLDKYPDLVKSMRSEEGAIAAFPKFYAVPSDISSGPMIRQDWLDDLGMENPTTFDELYDVLNAFRNEKGASAPLAIAMNTGVQAELLAGYNISGGYYQVDGEVRYGVIEPEFKEYLTMMNKWYSEGLIEDGFLTNNFESILDYTPILDNTAGVWYGTAVAIIPNLLESAEDPNMQIGAMTYVTKDGSQAHVGESRVLLDTQMWSVTTVCEEPDMVAKYVDYIYTEEGILLANYGVEGEGFEYVDGVPRLTDLILHHPEYSYSAAVNIFACDRMTPAPFIIDETRIRSEYTDAQNAAIAVWNESNDGLYNMPRSGVTLTIAEAEEYNTLYSDIETYEDENISKFVTGAKSLDEFDDFVETMKQMGIEDCIAMEQAAYDRYLER